MAVTAEVFANLALGTVTLGGTDAPAQGTVETWTVSAATAFATASSSASPPTVFYIADQAPGYGSEIIQVTNTSGSTWTVTRGADGTTPIAHLGGFSVIQVVTRASLQALASPNLDLQFLTGGGAITSSTLSSALAAGYQGIWLDSKYVWTISTTLVISGDTNVLIKSGMCGSNGYNGVVSYNTQGYVNITAGADGLQIYGTSGSATAGIVFEGIVFAGTSANALIHFGGRQRQCGLRYCMGYNTGTVTTTVASGSNTVNVNTFTGSGILHVASSASFPTSGQVAVTTTSQGQPGLALITYTGTGSGTLTGCSLTGGAGTLSTGNAAAPPQMAVSLDTALSNTNSEDQFFDHVNLASVSGIALGIDFASASGHANDTSYVKLTTTSNGGFASVAAMGGGGHSFWEFYDRSAAATAPVATVWNSGSGAVLNFYGGEDQNNLATGVTHLVDYSVSRTIITNRNMSVATNTAVATVTAGQLISRGACRWSGTINLAGGTLDLTDPAGYFNNSGAGVLSISGSSGTLALAAAYPAGGRPTVSGWTGATVNASGAPIPRDYNLLAWTANPDLVTGATVQPASGTIYIAEFQVFESLTINNMAILFVSATVTLTTGNYLGVYSPGATTFTQIGTTADMTSTWTGSNGIKQGALTAPLPLSPGRYYAAMLLTGTTIPTVRTLSGNAVQLSSVNLTNATLRCAIGATTQSSLTSLTVSGFNSSANVFGCVMW